MVSALVVLVAFATSDVPVSKQQQPQAAEWQGAKPIQNTTQRQQRPDSSVVRGSDKQDKDQKHHNGQTQSQPWTRGDIINLGIAIATTLYFLATLGILWAMIRANEKTDEALRVTQRSNALLEQSIQLSHRPSLHVTNLVLTNGLGPYHTRLTITICIKNSGSDVAHDIRIQPLAHAEDVELASLLVWASACVPTQHAGTLGAGLDMPPIDVTFDINPNLRAALNGTQPLHFAVIGAFSDVFQNTYRFESIWKLRTTGDWMKVFERQPPPTPAAA